MFDRTKFVNDVLSTYEGNNPQVMLPEVLNALDVKINYAKSKKLRAIVDNHGRVVCKSKKGGVVVKTTKGSTKIRLIINEGLLIGLLKSKNGTITLKPVDNEIIDALNTKKSTEKGTKVLAKK